MWYLAVSVALASWISLFSAPKIVHFSWGKIQVQHDDGSVHSYKDCKIFPDGSCEWNWNITGTRHKPGIQIGDLLDFVYEVDVVILSKGVQEILQTMQETITFLNEIGKKVYIEQSEKAVKLYNTLSQSGQKVGILLHSTC